MRTLFVCLIAFCLCARAENTGTARKAFAATVNAYATDAALAAMKEGGNAVDGAIAAAVTLGVVDSHNSGIGGGLFMIVRAPDGSFNAIDAREMAPGAATREMFDRNGKADPDLSQEGPLAAGVPGWLAGLEKAAAQFGKLPLGRHFATAAELARRGFKAEPGFIKRRDGMRAKLEKHPATAAILLRPLEDGVLRMPDLAGTYDHLAEEGPAWFYKGPFAEMTGAWMREHGGKLTAEDFRSYQVKPRELLRSSYRGYEIVGFPPPSSGGVHVGQILNILENFDLRAMGDGSPDFIHTVAEAMKLAFADRAHWLGDPDFVPVPRGLMDKGYAKTLAGKIDGAKSAPVPSHGTPPDLGSFSRHTTHFTVADADGYWVACTATINTTWGSLETIPGTGVILNNEMDDFAIAPGIPNAFGLVGAEANAVAPRKRPLSSMSPTIVLRDGKPVFTVGAAGGPTIITQAVLAIVRFVDFGLSPQAALAGPRFHQQWRPDALRIEKTVPEATRQELKRRGHQLNIVDSMGVAQAIGVGNEGFQGASDPRGSGKAAGL